MQEEMQQKDEKQEYQYFDMNAIKAKLEFSKENWEEGSRLIDSQFVLLDIMTVWKKWWRRSMQWQRTKKESFRLC